MPSNAHDSAVQHLSDERVEQDRLSERYEIDHESPGTHQIFGRYEASFEATTGDEDLEKPMTTFVNEHNRAEQRLGAALAEQHRSSDRYDAAVGRTAHLFAEVGLHAADQEVAARDAWLRWVDDEHYHGLNAGPFELFAEDAEL